MMLEFLKINNFRGIKSGSFVFPHNQRLCCIIGAGDSCKTTLLTAIEWCLWPSFNLNVTDTDFYNTDYSQKISIEATLSEVPSDLLTEDRFGFYLRDLNAVIENSDNDEPTDQGIHVMTVKLSIDETLEPVWNVITNRMDPKPIGQRDRKKLSIGIVGSDFEKDFQWGRNSVLQKYSDDTSSDSIHGAYTQTMREAAKNTDLSSLDNSISDKVKEIGKAYSIAFNGKIHNKLVLQQGRYASGISLFDDNIPLNLRGLGSRRLLSIGLNISASSEGTLLLIDEIENGLEPYRIIDLINKLRETVNDRGQVIFTTHSRTTICECNAEEILVMNTTQDGVCKLVSIVDQGVKKEIQANLRRDPDAFLCKRIIVCEGKTEIGFLRAFDKYLEDEYHRKFAYYGVGTAYGEGGDKTIKVAQLLKKCGYDVCILMDSDVSEEEQQKQDIENHGIKVFSWEKGNAIEEQVFQNINETTADKLVQLAIEENSYESVLSRLNSQFSGDPKRPFNAQVKKIQITDWSEEVRKTIGTLAKKGGWYKQIGKGENFGNIVFESFDDLSSNCGLKQVIEQLRMWVMPDE